MSAVPDRGIGPACIRPAAPRFDGKAERPHRIDAEEFHRLLDGVPADGAEVFGDKPREWEGRYGFHRPHGGLGGRTPFERLPRKTGPRTATDRRRSRS
ncbi:transposase [Nocardiopsis sp. CNT-189]|uniref:hypothetical protein n=1 Tax=Nocardiopsis oceanisediminis TaxID=2816862 RepID=UPI003B2AC0E2